MSPKDEYDVIVVGGGTAGAVVAARLAEQTDANVALLEWGPTDEGEPRALQIRRWAEMLEGEYDLDYASEPQERGNSRIRQSRAKILGGCSSHNTMIMWRPLASDLEEWVAAGAEDWDADHLDPYFEKLRARVPLGPVAEADRNPYLVDATRAAADALGVPLVEGWNDREVLDGAGFCEIGYDPATGIRSSSSVTYLHPTDALPENLALLTGQRVTRVVLEDGRAVGVELVDAAGSRRVLRARHEVVLSCGAIDTPRLLLLSGVGPREVLDAAGIDVVHDLPGVGENLMDHPEGLVVWEASRPLEPINATDWDAVVLARLSPEVRRPDILMHIPLLTWAMHAEAEGIPTPEHSLSMTPNVAKPLSRGRVWIDSADPEAPPRIDYRYFTDPEGHDERVLVEGIKLARRIAAQPPMSDWVVRETFPGPDVVTDAQISAAARATHHTVYHVSGTCRMGAPEDPAAVVDPSLRVRGLDALRVVDASVFPVLTAVNPVGTVMVVAERAAELIIDDWRVR